MSKSLLYTFMTFSLLATSAMAQTGGEEPEGGSALVGTYLPVKIGSGNAVLRDGTDGLGFYTITTSTTVKANSAYLSVGETTLIDMESLITAIEEVREQEMEDGRWKIEDSPLGGTYDLSGRRVTPSKPGIYIHNKKKIIY